MAFTFLRDNFYLDFMEPFAGEDRVLRGPAGDGRVGMVARADVARVAAAVLRSPDEHAGVTYTLTGPEALTLTEVAATLTAARGRALPVPQRDDSTRRTSRAQKYGAPDWQVEAWVTTYTAMAAGQLDVVTDDVERDQRPETSVAGRASRLADH